jgi:hypothetical protein
VKTVNQNNGVIPAKAGIHLSNRAIGTMDSGFRRNDVRVKEHLVYESKPWLAHSEGCGFVGAGPEQAAARQRL